MNLMLEPLNNNKIIFKKRSEGRNSINAIIVGVFNTSLSTVDTLFRQKNKREILDLNNIIHHMNLTETYRIFHPMLAEILSLLKCTWNIIQDRKYLRPQNVLTNLKRLKSYQESFLAIVV